MTLDILTLISAKLTPEMQHLFCLLPARNCAQIHSQYATYSMLQHSFGKSCELEWMLWKWLQHQSLPTTHMKQTFQMARDKSMRFKENLRWWSVDHKQYFTIQTNHCQNIASSPFANYYTILNNTAPCNPKSSYNPSAFRNNFPAQPQTIEKGWLMKSSSREEKLCTTDRSLSNESLLPAILLNIPLIEWTTDAAMSLLFTAWA